MRRPIFFIVLALLSCMPLRSQVQQFFTSDSLASITSPLDLDSLFYWFAADLGVLDSLGGAIATDEGVGTWNDQSGNGRHVTQTTNTDRPVYKATGGPGGKPCIQFDGTDDFLASAAHFWGSDDITIIAVVKFVNPTRNLAEIVVAKNEASGNTRQWIFAGQNTLVNYVGDYIPSTDGTAQNPGRTANNWKHTAWKAHAITSDGTTCTWYTDGSALTLADSGVSGIFNSSTPKLSIGAVNVIAAPASFLQGSICEIAVFSRPLTAAELSAMHNYLNKKYDLY